MCSETMLSFLHKSSKQKPKYSIQKYHRLFAEGLTLNGVAITALISLPTSFASNRKLFWFKKREFYNDINYIYLPFINIPYLRQIMIVMGSFLYASIWSLKHKGKNSLIITDVLNVSISLSVLAATRIFKKNICGLVTDLPEMLDTIRNERRLSLMGKTATFLSTCFLSSFDLYIILTRQMNQVVNKNGKPSFILEGLVDSKISIAGTLGKELHSERIILYSGGIYKKYGIKKLLQAFHLLKDQNMRLHIYGSGEMEKEIEEFVKKDGRVFYFGVVPNHEIIDRQIKATILVNPRSSKEEFTLYSFPSKNLEYMVSGTPLITTQLPGIGEEYLNYVYVFEDESIDGISRKLKEILSKSDEDLERFGNRAREFVLKEKNNKIQAERFLKFLADNSLLES